MKPHAKAVFLAACAVLTLSGCSTLSGDTKGLSDALTAIASDPNCGHTDRISGNLGGLSGNNLNIFLERTCPARPATNVADRPAVTSDAPT